MGTSDLEVNIRIAVLGRATHQTVITPWSMWAAHPDWHPTRDLVLFYSRPWKDFSTGPSNLYTARSDGSQLTQITHFTKGQTRTTQPSFTPGRLASSIPPSRATATGSRRWR